MQPNTCDILVLDSAALTQDNWRLDLCLDLGIVHNVMIIKGAEVSLKSRLARKWLRLQSSKMYLYPRLVGKTEVHLILK